MKKLNHFFLGLLIISTLSCSSDEPVHTPVTSTPAINSETTIGNSEITLTTIKISGKVISNGNSEVTSRGVCWSKNPNPTINDNKTNEASNTFSTTITNLTANTKYYFRVFAINDLGISYGPYQSFSTLSLSDTVWKFSTHYTPNQYSSGSTIDSKIEFYSDGTTKFDEIGSGQGYFITYGTWSLSGNNITYHFDSTDPNNPVYIYNGTLSGMTMNGTFTHPSSPGTWDAIPF
jgi:hypothetical protein